MKDFLVRDRLVEGGLGSAQSPLLSLGSESSHKHLDRL